MERNGKDFYGLEVTRCLNRKEIRKLRTVLKKRIENSQMHYGDSALKQWFLCEFGLSTGLRVSEIKNICIKHLFNNVERPYIWVENGKGGKSRRVEIDLQFKTHLSEYLVEKTRIKETTFDDSPLFYSKRSKGKYSVRGLEYMFKKSLDIVSISDIYSIHCLRHSFALAVYKATKFNIRYVQKQLGHSSLRITEIYLQTLMSELQKPLKKIY